MKVTVCSVCHKTHLGGNVWRLMPIPRSDQETPGLCPEHQENKQCGKTLTESGTTRAATAKK